MGADRLTPSTVVDLNGKDKNENERTSKGAFIREMDDLVMRMIEERIAMWTKLPAENGEHFYLLHYDRGDEYKPHFDAFDPDTPEATNFTGLFSFLLTKPKLSFQQRATWTTGWGSAGPRIATVLLHLRAPTAGGETEFPIANVSVPIRRGDATLFWTYSPEMKWDPLSLHAGKPVIEGEKVIATKWIRQDKIHPRPPLKDSFLYHRLPSSFSL